jgi:CRP/FNR family cyclic AMP-dependent transcriptional regulator
MIHKKTVLVVSGAPNTREYYALQLKEHFPDVNFFQAVDGSDALTKMNNAIPNVLMTDCELPKISGAQLVEKVLKKEQFDKMTIILVALLPKKEQFLEEFITGRLQFLENAHDDEEFKKVMSKALGLSTGETPASEFKVTKIKAGDVFLKQGDPASSVYIIRSGQLRAYRIIDGQEIVLGTINPGEFVGEMSYINNQPRSANVQALTDCEAVEVSMGTFEKVLQQRPTWAKALMQTLTKRVVSP